MKKYILLGIFFISILSGCNEERTDSNTVANTSGTITTKVGVNFVINLESNITTGYSWRLVEPETGILELVGNEYQPYENTGNMVGSGGTEIWTFKAIDKGKTTITLEYVRPWEKEVPSIKQETYLITVK